MEWGIWIANVKKVEQAVKSRTASTRIPQYNSKKTLSKMNPLQWCEFVYSLGISGILSKKNSNKFLHIFGSANELLPEQNRRKINTTQKHLMKYFCTSFSNFSWKLPKDFIKSSQNNWNNCKSMSSYKW